MSKKKQGNKSTRDDNLHGTVPVEPTLNTNKKAAEKGSQLLKQRKMKCSPLTMHMKCPLGKKPKNATQISPQISKYVRTVRRSVKEI